MRLSANQIVSDFRQIALFFRNKRLLGIFWFATIAALFASISEIAFARMLSLIFEYIQSTTRGPVALGALGIIFPTFTWIAGVTIAVILVRGFIQFLALYLQELFRETIELIARDSFVMEALSGPVDRLEQSELTNVLADIIPKFSLWLTAYIRIITLALSALVFSAYSIASSAFMFGVIMVLSMLSFLISKSISRRSTQYGQERYGVSVSFNDHVGRAKRNHKYLKLLRIEFEELRRTLEFSKKYFNLSNRGVFYYSLANVLPNVLGLVLFVAVVAIAVNRFDVAALMPILYILLRMVQTLSMISSNHNVLKINEPQFRAVMANPRMQTPTPALPQSSQQNQRDFSSRAIRIDIDGLSVYRPRSTDRLLSNVRFSVGSGEVVVLFGRSGCGKTTLVNSILGIEAPASGTIRVDGKAVADLSFMYDQIGYVGPDPYLIRGTARENLLFGNQSRGIDDHQIIEACRLAGLDDLIKSEEHLESISLSENGEGLSAGQKQRISIARALVRKPSLLVFDEGTANLDVKTEATVIRNILGMARPPAVMVVSHRKSILDFTTNSIDVEAFS